MPNFTGKSGGGPHHMKKGYGKGKNPIMLTEKGKEKIMASNANPEFKEAIANSPVEMDYGSPMEKNYGSPIEGKYAPGQLAAIHASKAEKRKRK